MKFFPRFALVLFFSAWAVSYAGAQQLICQPCNDHYGQVPIGTRIQPLIQLKNTGTRSLRIRAKSLTGAAFTFGNFPLPVDIGVGKTVKMPIIFAPTVLGKNTGTITLTSNATNSSYVIAVQGVGVSATQPHLSTNPSSLNFGSVTVGASASLGITLSATGAAVTISSIQSNSSEYTWSGPTLPTTMAAGQNVTVTTQFKPNASGTASAALTVSSNADNSSNSVSLTGVGVTAPSHRADLTWDPSTDSVIGYNVYRGGVTGGPYAQINTVVNAPTNFTDGTVKGGSIYYYVVTAVDAASHESAGSNEVKVAIPSP